MDVKNFFSKESIDFLGKAIEKAEGSKLYFKGIINQHKKVSKLVVLAPGDSDLNITRYQSSAILVCNHEKTPLKLSARENTVVKMAKDNGYGFILVSNDLKAVEVVVKPTIKNGDYINLDIETTANYISKGGALDKMSENFEERPVQIELLKSITNAFNENKIAAFEAGTGVGKSYAYLIPAALWAAQNDEKIIISTGTINLQHQLCEKDIPMVEKILGRKIKYMLMKGRQNYLCLRRLQDYSQSEDLAPLDTDNMRKLGEWAKKSETGCKSDLTFFCPDTLWTNVNSDSELCMGKDCPFFGECFIQKMRNQAVESSLLVVNHHLLFADIEARKTTSDYNKFLVLPGYNRVIFDEAHGIENAATSFFSESFSARKMTRLLNKVYKRRAKIENGFLPVLAGLADDEKIKKILIKQKTELETAFEMIETTAFDFLGRDYNKRICSTTRSAFEPLRVLLSEYSRNLSIFADNFEELLNNIPDDYRTLPVYWEAEHTCKNINSASSLIKAFADCKLDPEHIFWLERISFKRKNSTEPSIYALFTITPLEIADKMKKQLFDKMQSVISTSATLTTNNNFSYWIKRIGMDTVESDRIATATFDSPFPYEKNMLFCVPKDAPGPDNCQFQQYVEMSIPKLIKASSGSTLVLFTSYDSLYRTYRAAQSSLPSSITLLKQGDSDSGKLLEVFKNDEKSVLFATDSFWQGVDVPGEALKQVIIVKLPFSVPNDPIFISRSERIVQEGGNSFMDLSIPDAIIKYRQGIGRLIRRSDDKGAVVVLDNRIYTKRYGSMFLASTPECKKLYAPLDEIISKIKSFIFE